LCAVITGLYKDAPLKKNKRNKKEDAPLDNDDTLVDMFNERLRSHLRFCGDNGKIWLRENRMLLVHAQARGEMRREIIDSFGLDSARALFFRMGYASGVRDYEITRVSPDIITDVDAFRAGPLIYALEGGVKTTIKKLEIDSKAGKFYSEIRCEHSWEGQAHLRYYGESSEGVCWSLTGYASGYTSAVMGETILWREVGCVSKDMDYCTLIGKPIEEWEDAEEVMRLLKQSPIDVPSLGPEALTGKKVPPVIRIKRPSQLIGRSQIFVDAYKLLVQASTSQITVLLQGETGVGKEVFARLLHSGGARSKKPFVAVNCAAIPHDLVESELFGVEKGAYTGAQASRPGRFQRANGGTLFLDEISEMPLSAQVKLLRVLQEGEVERLGGTKTEKVDVRLVAASNIDLRPLIEEGKFRADLYYRVNVLQITIPPLREREFDVLIIAKKFLKRYSILYNKKLRGFTDKAKQALLDYPWPGNIRELQNIVERSALLVEDESYIEATHLFPLLSSDDDLGFGIDMSGGLTANQKKYGKEYCDAVLSGKLTMDQANTMLLETALEKAKGNLSAAGRLLGLTRAQLAYRLEKKKE